MKSAVTISLVPESRGGPFVFWDDLAAGCRAAKSLGFDAVEIFPPGPDAIDTVDLRKLLVDNGLAVAAVGTGAGWVKHKLTLTSPDPETHAKAMAFVESLIDFAAVFDAPVIIGSMQGRMGRRHDPRNRPRLPLAIAAEPRPLRRQVQPAAALRTDQPLRDQPY